MKAQIFYFPKSTFGHIAVKITFADAVGLHETSAVREFLKENKTIYFNYGGRDDFDQDCQGYGEYVCIDLPETDKSTSDFFIEIEKTANEHYKHFNLGELGKTFTEGSETYNTFKNNCAHATQQILYMAGYISKKPKLTFGLLPSTVAKQATKIACKAAEIARKASEDIDKKNKKEADTVKQLLSLCETYIKHLPLNPEEKSIAYNKLAVVNSLRNALIEEDVSGAKTNVERLKAFTRLLTPENKKIISAHRDSAGIRFLAKVAHILTFGIISKLTKGTFAFWKSHGEAFSEQAEEITKKVHGI